MADMITKLLVYCKAGSPFKFPEGLDIGGDSVRADFVKLPNGDTVGVVYARNANIRQQLEKVAGITVAPPMHRPIGAAAAQAFGHAGLTAADTGYDLAMKLFQVHGIPQFHPENGPG